MTRMLAPQPIRASVARLLLDAGAVHFDAKRPFSLAAGWASPVYVDVRALISAPQTRRAVSDLAASYVRDCLSQERPDAIVGAETAGIPFATLVAEALDLPLRYVRKRPLGIGRNAQVEGGPIDGMTVLLLDDLTTDGSSKLHFARGIRSAGAQLSNVLSIFYHDAFRGADRLMSENGLVLHALATWSDIIDVDGASALQPAERAVIAEFLADPIKWSTRHGGRSAPDS